MHYAEYKSLAFERPQPGILEIVMGREGKLAVAGCADASRARRDLAAMSTPIPTSRSPIIRGVGKGFSGGGSLDLGRK